MANTYQLLTVRQMIPCKDVTLFEEAMLGSVGIDCIKEKDSYYLCSPEFWGDVVIENLDTIDSDEGKSDPRNDTYFGLIDSGESEIMVETILQEIVKRSPTIAYLSVMGCHYCDKMRVDGFGGFSWFITAGEIKYVSTHDWLDQQEKSYDRT